MPEVCSLLFGNTNDNGRFQIGKVQNEIVWVTGENPEFIQHVIREVFGIHRYDCTCAGPNGRSWNMPVPRVRQYKAVYHALISTYQTVWNGAIDTLDRR
jgi:hypothetical protein